MTSKQLPAEGQRAHVLVLPLLVCVQPETNRVILTCKACHDSFVILGTEAFPKGGSIEDILEAAAEAALIPDMINAALAHVLNCKDKIDDKWRDYEITINGGKSHR